MKNFFNLLALIAISSMLVVTSCNKEKSDNECYESNPVEELTWLKTMINDMSDYDYIMSAKYHG